MDSKKHLNFGYLTAGLGLMVILSRILPHAPNFTASIATIIFSATILKSWKSFLLIILAYVTSDLIINNVLYSQDQFLWLSSGFIWVLVPFFIIYVFVKLLYKKEMTPIGLIGTSLLSSGIFFLISNFGVWISSAITYSKDINGLLLCYFNAIPFLAYELAGSLFYSVLIFSVYWLYFYNLKVYEYQKPAN